MFNRQYFIGRVALGLLVFLISHGSAAAQQKSSIALPFAHGEQLLYQAELNRGLLRGFDVGELAGFLRISFFRTLGTGAILLFFAYPLIGFSETMNQRFFGGGSSKQGIVEFFSGSRTIQERIIIIVFAVAIAPIVEEFVFRFFIYGVLKRYVGCFLGVILSSLLFATAHAHLPSFVPLFVLGSCFAIAYEWSGSILVSMTMHSLFNSLTLTALAFPEILSQ